MRKRKRGRKEREKRRKKRGEKGKKGRGEQEKLREKDVLRLWVSNIIKTRKEGGSKKL